MPSKIKRYTDILFNKRMLMIFIMGFSSGLPLALTGSTLKARITDAHVDLTTVGFFSLVGIPYVAKLLWSPIFDRFTPPLGRRRGWLVLTQLGLMASLVLMAFMNPANALALVGLSAVLIAFFSASQDIVIDAYRREILSDVELAWGSALVVNGYRVAMLVSGGLALMLSDHMSWTDVYLIMAACVGIGFLASFFADEPDVEGTPPKSIAEAYSEPFLELMKRKGAFTILGFIFLYKLGDAMALENSIYFYKTALQFQNQEIGAIVKLFGFWGVIGGGLIGSLVVIRFGLFRALFAFGVAQIACILGFAWLSTVGHDRTALAGVVLAENLTVGMSTAAYVTYLSTQVDKRFSAAQYALLSSITGLPRVIFGSFAGLLAAKMGWLPFFVFCGCLGVPALLMIPYIHRLNRANHLTAPEGSTSVN